MTIKGKDSCEGYRAIPTESLGLEYRAIAYSPAKYKTQVTLVGSADSTQVVIALPANQGTK